MTNRATLLSPLLVLLAQSALSQEVSRPTDAAPTLLAADERTLWLSTTLEDRAALFRRGVSEAFDLGRPLASAPLMLTVTGDAYVFFRDGSAQRFPATGNAETVRILPDGALPIDVIGDGGRLYALIDGGVAEKLEPGSQPIEPITPVAGALAVVVLDLEWRPMSVVDVPVRPKRTPELGPKLLIARERMTIAWVGSEGAIHVSWRDPLRARWETPVDVARVNASRLWLTHVNGVATLVAVVDEPQLDPPIRAWRLLGELSEGAAAWRDSPLVWSALPPGVVLSRPLNAAGFNQHLALLGADAGGAAYVRFARFGEPPAEQTLRVRTIVEHVQQVGRTFGALQMATFVVLLLIIAGLFTFRRDSMSRVVTPPQGAALALAAQRLSAWLIDFVPFSYAAARALDLPWLDSLRGLASWGISPDPKAGLPSGDVLLWWGLSAGGHTVYLLVMELLSGRSVGKVIVGTRVISENAVPASKAQIVVRNLCRLVELMPQFWIFGFLLLLSRNRQRLGDIFARTVVIRRAPQPNATA